MRALKKSIDTKSQSRNGERRNFSSLSFSLCLPLCRIVFAFIIGFSSTAYCQEFDQDLMKRSSVVFIGTVSKLNAASFAEVPASEKNAVVRVDVLLEKPGAVSISIGQDVTLRLKDPSVFREGMQATFYADGWIVGRGVALTEVDHKLTQEADSPSIRVTAARSYGNARKQLIEAKLRAQIDSADVVALGKVIAVRPLTQTNADKKFITEHDPEWQEAIIKIQTGMKGVADGDEIVVRFSGSMDVAYYRMPKFKEGEERIVLLGKDERSGFPKAMLAGKQVGTYLAEKPADVVAKENLDLVQRIVKER